MKIAEFRVNTKTSTNNTKKYYYEVYIDVPKFF